MKIHLLQTSQRRKRKTPKRHAVEQGKVLARLVFSPQTLKTLSLIFTELNYYFVKQR